MAKDTGMYQNLIRHETPVNKQAASMFWKTPWWAEVSEPVKRLIAEEVFSERLPAEEINVSYFRPPPEVAANETKPKDWRGAKVYIYPDSPPGIVTGYAHTKKISTSISPSSAKRTSAKRKPSYWIGEWDYRQHVGKKVKENSHRWWIFIEGRFQTLKGNRIHRHLKKFERRSSNV